MLFRDFLLVAIGSAVGGMLRYGLALLFPTTDGRLPWATIAANLLGCLAFGIIAGLLRNVAPSAGIRLALLVGLCGGFTTYSSFANEQMLLLREGQLLIAVAYIVGTLSMGTMLLWLGFKWGSSHAI